MAKRWEGIYCALWTPTGPDGELLERELRANLEFLLSKGVHGLLALGSTGEFLHLEIAQRKKYVETVLAGCDGLPVIVNISDIRPAAVAELGRFSRERNAAAVAILPPYFFPLAQSDLVEFFVRGGEAAQLPVFLYNFPERVGNRISLETIEAVATRIPLAGVKQSGSEFGYHRSLVELGQKKNFVVFTGSDTALPEAMALGVTGCVSGLANALPDLMRAVYDGVKMKVPGSELAAAGRMRQIGVLVDKLEFPLNVAAAIEARGLAQGSPKSVVSPQTRDRYQKLLGDLRFLYREWKLIE